MALFSRRKNASADDASSPSETPEMPVEAADQPAAGSDESVPEVSISVSTFGGLGASPAQSTPAEPQLPPGAVPVASADMHNPDGTVKLPFAPDAPPADWESVPGLRDNAVLRDALARLPESPSNAELLGVVRQLLQGHLFLRVKGNAQEQVEAGQDLQLGVIRDGDRNFLLAFSSGRALQQAVQADGDADTSSFGQPSVLVLRHLVAGDFAGLVIDNASNPARLVVPRELIARALAEADDELRLKTLIAADRTTDPERIVPAVVQALGEAKMFVAVGIAGEKDGQPVRGIAEVRTADGKRYLQLFSHPLEVVALGRDEQAAPFDLETLKTALKEESGIDGVLIDPAGPNLRVSRDDLQQLLPEV